MFFLADIRPPTDPDFRGAFTAVVIFNPVEEAVIVHAHMTLVEPAVDGVQIAEENSLSHHIHESIPDKRDVVVEISGLNAFKSRILWP